MSGWMNAAEIAALKLPGLPSDTGSIIRRADREGWNGRKREGTRGGGLEYPVSALPAPAQNAIAKRKLSAKKQELQPAAALPAPESLKTYQREPMEARKRLLDEIDQLGFREGISQGKAINALIDLAASGGLSPDLQALIPIANARIGQGRSLSRRTVYRWIEERAKSGGNVVALAPAAVEEAPIPVWAGVFMDLYGRPQKPAITDVLNNPRWPAEIEKPSYSQARRFLDRVDAITKNQGRMGQRALQAMKAYISRDVSELWPGAVFIGDGHTYKAEVAHPKHGQPFRPEVTAILDVYTRRWVGWSVDLAENTWAVADALRHAVMDTTCCAIFYYDNGSGAKNDVWDNNLTGLIARLGITKNHSAPWSSQARGVIERFNSAVMHKSARQHATYVGQRMDKEAKQAAFKITRKDIKATGTSRLLPSWQEFGAEMSRAQAEYNARPHDLLPKIVDTVTGKRRNMSPMEFWEQSVADGWVPEPLGADEARDLFRPAETRKVSRCIVELFSNQYFHQDLGVLHDQQVIVGYDIHDVGRVWVRMLDGRFLCEAILEGNKRGFIPKSVAQQAEEKRVKNKLTRLENHADVARAELGGPVIDAMPLAIPTPAETAAMAKLEALMIADREAEEAAREAEMVPIAFPVPVPKVDAPARPVAGLSEIVNLTEIKNERVTAASEKRQRFDRALDVKFRIEAGREVSDADAGFFARYQVTPEYKTLWNFYTEFGEAALNF